MQTLIERLRPLIHSHCADALAKGHHPSLIAVLHKCCTYELISNREAVEVARRLRVNIWASTPQPQQPVIIGQVPDDFAESWEAWAVGIVQQAQKELDTQV